LFDAVNIKQYKNIADYNKKTPHGVFFVATDMTKI